eukprot:TRINITY_DN3130_c0_g1_i1.p1 TRINITY_DN3130_c0_g1~~TRINITY_DN3130_c0_g1_i1.p1  ORF type:complete len:591 (+),score=146.16 TRINITY_DN3130_c0_g1_i1:211-1773(+)
MGNTGSAARTYDGHRGIDTGIANFRRMDNGQALIRAAAPGVVTKIVADQPDRNSVWCPNLAPADQPSWNVVEVTAANGWRVLYGHMKRYSTPVTLNQHVVAGQVLGVVGSSGCSTDPHLHFEVRDCSNNAVETVLSNWFVPDMWSPNPPAYNPTSNIMDVMLKNGKFSGGDELRDPPADVKVMPKSAILGIGVVSVAIKGDAINIQVHNPSGLYYTINSNLGGDRKARLRNSWWVTLNNVVGQWRVEVRMNGVLRSVKYFKVSSYPTGMKEIVLRAVKYQDYQNAFDDVTAAGYRPELTDGYNLGSQGFLNAVYRPNTGAYISSSRLDATQYQAKFDSRPSGWRPTLVESYLHGGNIRYALILKPKTGGAWAAFHGVPLSDWTNKFNYYRANGYSPLMVFVVSYGGTLYYTALWEKRNIGSWYVNTRLRLSDYQSVFNQQTQNENRRPMYLNAYSHNGVTYVSVIFASGVPTVFGAKHGMSSASLTLNVATNNNANRLTNTLTGYSSGSSHYYAAAWWTP